MAQLVGGKELQEPFMHWIGRGGVFLVYNDSKLRWRERWKAREFSLSLALGNPLRINGLRIQCRPGPDPIRWTG